MSVPLYFIIVFGCHLLLASHIGYAVVDEKCYLYIDPL